MCVYSEKKPLPWSKWSWRFLGQPHIALPDLLVTLCWQLDLLGAETSGVIGNRSSCAVQGLEKLGKRDETPSWNCKLHSCRGRQGKAASRWVWIWPVGQGLAPAGVKDCNLKVWDVWMFCSSVSFRKQRKKFCMRLWHMVTLVWRQHGKSLPCGGLRLWNSLPRVIKSALSLLQFRR